jgi:folate-binding protein YgfZ
MTQAIPQRVPLRDFDLLEVRGPDSLKFLQGQLTCDTRRFSADALTHGAHCTPKGRMIANFDALAPSEELVLLRLRRDALPLLSTSLGKYIVFSKAELSAPGGEAPVGLLGEHLLDWLQQHLDLDFSQQTVQQQGGLLYIKRDQQRVECWPVDEANLPDVVAELPQADNETAWLAAEIALGRGWIGAATSDTLLPQQLHLQVEAIDGVSFTKGCYTGQEIIARTHYKGKVKRALHRLQADSEISLAEGTDLHNGAGSIVGSIVNAVSYANCTQCLAILSEDVAQADDVFVDKNATQKLTPLPLPYAINT